LTNPYKYGDYVTIGKNKLTWKILAIKQSSGNIIIESGQTGRHKLVRPEQLTMHTAATKIPQMIGETFDPK